MNEKRGFNLTTLLQEDGIKAEEIAALLPILSQIADTDTPSPTAVETETLFAALLPEMPGPLRRESRLTAVSESWPWLLLQAQLRVVRREIWAASALVITLGVAVSLLWQGVGGAAGLPLSLLAPVVAAVGIALLYGSASSVWELELATAVPPPLLLLTRLLLVFGFDLMLAVAGSMILTLISPQLTLWSLVTIWLAPMTFLAALAFLITVLSGAAEIGMIVTLGLWAVQVTRMMSLNLGIFSAYWPDLLTADSRPWLMALALLLVIGALWLGSREEHWLTQSG